MNILLILFMLFGTYGSKIGTDSIVYGYIEENTIRMDIKDVYAVWIPDFKELEVYFVPIKLTQNDVKEAIKDNIFFMTQNKPSPDSAKWERCPFGHVVIDFEEDKQPALETITNYFFVTGGITQENINGGNYDPIGLDPKEDFHDFSMSLSGNQGSLKMFFQGTSKEFDGDTCSWEIDIERAKIYVK